MHSTYPSSAAINCSACSPTDANSEDICKRDNEWMDNDMWRNVDETVNDGNEGGRGEGAVRTECHAFGKEGERDSENGTINRCTIRMRVTDRHRID